MPSAKKKRQAKNEDFKKKKLKVGKTKALPDSFTDTSFRAKNISLPNQSITEDKSQELTTSRNLTLPDLLAQLKHYNAGVRKDAIVGLQELCQAHTDVLSSSLSSIINSIVKLFVDDDRDVRKALLGFLEDTFTTIEQNKLRLFMPLLMMYTCSAMSHILEDIRLDAVKLISLWIRLVPEIVVSSFWTRVIDNYKSLLAVQSTSIGSSSVSVPGARFTTTSSVKAAVAKSHLHVPKNKLDLFDSLTNVLEAGLFDTHQDRFWFMLESLQDRRARDNFERRFGSSTAKSASVCWETQLPEACSIPHPMLNTLAPYLSASSLDGPARLGLFDLAGPKPSSATSTASTASTKQCSLRDRRSEIQNLVETFHPAIISTWLDTAPSVFTSGTMIMTPALNALHVILRLSLVLWRAFMSSGTAETVKGAWIQTHLESWLKHLLIYFPPGAESLGSRPGKVHQVLQDMTTATCELVAMYLTLQASVLKSTGMDADRPHWCDRVLDHVLVLLGYEETAGQHTEGTMTSMHTEFKTKDFVSLLPSLWGFLHSLDESRRTRLVEALLGYYDQAHPQSATRKIVLEFIARAVLIQSTPSYTGQYMMEAEQLKPWLERLSEAQVHVRADHGEAGQSLAAVLTEFGKRMPLSPVVPG